MLLELTMDGNPCRMRFDNDVPKDRALDWLASSFNLKRVPKDVGDYVESDYETDKFRDPMYMQSGMKPEEVTIEYSDGVARSLNGDGTYTNLTPNEVSIIAEAKAYLFKKSISTANVKTNQEVPSTVKPEEVRSKTQKGTTTTTSKAGATSIAVIPKPQQSRRVPDSKFMTDPASTGILTYNVEKPSEEIDVAKQFNSLANSTAMPIPAPVLENRVKPMVVTPEVVGQPPKKIVNSNPASMTPTFDKPFWGGYEYMIDVDQLLCEGGKYVVKYSWDFGLLKASVRLAEKPDIEIQDRSMIFDLNGYIVTGGAKWWPGVNGSAVVDFKQAYKYSIEDIKKYLEGKLAEITPLYNGRVAGMNRKVDLRSITAVNGIDSVAVQHIFNIIYNALDPKTMRKELGRKCRDSRFVLKEFIDQDNFTLATMQNVYKYVGGEPANNDTEFKLVFVKDAPVKLVE